MELTYKEVSTINPTDARKRIVQTYHQTGNYCETARRWHTSVGECSRVGGSRLNRPVVFVGLVGG